MAPVIEARAQARLAALGAGSRRETLDRARATLDRAHDALADLPAGQRSDTALGYTERQLYFYTGDILVGLGDWQGAHRAFGRAGQLYAATEVLDCALVAFGQASCLLQADEPDEALAVGRDILAGLPAEHRTDVRHPGGQEAWPGRRRRRPPAACSRGLPRRPAGRLTPR